MQSLNISLKWEPNYNYLGKQIPVLIALSLFPGLGYIFLAYRHSIHIPAVIWYGCMVIFSLWGWYLHRQFQPQQMSHRKLRKWYGKVSLFFYGFFFLWVAIFTLYITKDEYNLHYIAVFTEIGTSVVVATLLYSEKRLFYPLLIITILPLIIYFLLVGTFYGYVLSIFSATLGWVLLYAARSSHELLNKTQYQATHDVLTGLPNRQFFIEHIQRLMNGIQENKNYSFLLLIDLDHFKIVNDSLGHDVGDELLRQVSVRLLEKTPYPEWLVARLGGDEFIVTGKEYSSRERCKNEALEYAQNLILSLKETYVSATHHFYISASIGISIIDSSSANANTFVREADIALYEVKANGRDGIFLFDRSLATQVERHLNIERMLHFALEREEIFLVFQPQFNKGKKIIGAEVLVRWKNYRLGEISPVEFISIAEQTGLILELGNFILREALVTLQTWQAQNIVIDQFSINISKRQMLQHDFVENTIALLDELNLLESTRKRIVFEITESVVAEDIKRIIEIMDELKKQGIRFSMDDFGTGYSSLSYLKMLPIDEIKIDKQFVKALNTSKKDTQMLTTILNMASIFQLSIVAEGVETEDQFAYLKDQLCDYFQGFYFSKPLSKEEFAKLFVYSRIEMEKPAH